MLKNARKYDLVLLRYSMHDPFQWVLTRFLKNYGTLHHAFELEEIELTLGKSKLVRTLFERYLGRRVIARSKVIVGVTDEICRYEVSRLDDAMLEAPPVFVYPNGIECLKTVTDKRSNAIECVFVSWKFQPWVGLDLIIREYEKYGSLGMTIHLIGHVPSEFVPQIKEMDLFVCHGPLFGRDLMKLYETAWLGITSFGFHRKKMKQACTLKAREYLCAGIPVVGGYEEVGFPECFPFYTKLECDLQNIKRVALEGRKVRRDEVRAASMPFIEKKSHVKNLVAFLNN